ncbi:hypothetical protein CAI21_21905 [Alkalilimnicola ehrlichii]|uniref:Uncharacterized protein n=1 Tax=Alkalilimnicola ehrlichii TaxID=351052 RepID=A0A3E0WID0_9GAMM|nr:hypothetical protein [Alkalilimnicola ehrlichii]RFA24365.1 hypothetical protein CAI21_21905 [Alkalilimnicola ehrlichii]RFA31625.1 hypothetical protein CAL65_22020 [Alkalilimnicola ehrlichii]
MVDGAASNIDAHDWMQQLRFEYYRVAQLRRLRVGEQLWVGYFGGRGVSPEIDGHCEAYFTRNRGGYFSFHAIWTICWGGNRRRPHVFTHGDFKLLPGNRIEFQGDAHKAERSFRLVCRYVYFIYRNMRQLGVDPEEAWRNDCKPLSRGEHVLKHGLNARGVEGPEVRGLSAIVETAAALAVLGRRSGVANENPGRA